MKMRIAMIEVESENPEAVQKVLDSFREAFRPSVDGKSRVAVLEEAPREPRRRKPAQLEPAAPAEPATPAEGEETAEPAREVRKHEDLSETEQKVIIFLEELGRAASARRIAMEGLGWKTSNNGFKRQLLRLVEEGRLYTDDGGRTFEMPIKEA